jgi:TonB family protein
VKFKQIRSGMVMDAQVEKCTGDEAFKRAVEMAVKKTSQLPLPPDTSVFEPDLEFTFEPKS